MLKNVTMLAVPGKSSGHSYSTKTSSLQSPSKSSAPPVYSPFAPPDFSSARLYLALSIDLSHSRKPFPLHTNNLHGSHGLCSRVDTTLRPQEAGGAAGRPASPLQECPHPSAHSRFGVPLRLRSKVGSNIPPHPRCLHAAAFPSLEAVEMAAGE